MTVFEQLLRMVETMMGNCPTVITYGPYCGPHKIALRGTANKLLDIVDNYPLLAKGQIDPNGVFVNHRGEIELLNTLYEGEYLPRYEINHMKKGICATYMVRDISAAKAAKRVSLQYRIPMEELEYEERPVVLKTTGMTDMGYVSGNSLFGGKEV